MSDNNQDSYRFNEFRLDVGERLLVRDNLSVPLTPKVFDVLAVLVERSGHLVEKDEVLRIVWEDSFRRRINRSAGGSHASQSFGRRCRT